MPATALTYACPFCQKEFTADADQIGHQVSCPHCNRPVKIEAPAATLVRGQSGDGGDDDLPERIIVTRHPVMARAHPMLFIGYIALIVLGVLLGVIPGMITGFLGITAAAWILQIAGLILVVIGAALLGWWWLMNRGTTLQVTDKRTRLVRGIIAKHSTEVQHDDVRNIQIHQNWIQRLINVGDVAVSSSGQDDLEISVKGIPAPNAVANEIRKRQ